MPVGTPTGRCPLVSPVVKYYRHAGNVVMKFCISNTYGVLDPVCSTKRSTYRPLSSSPIAVDVARFQTYEIPPFRHISGPDAGWNWISHWWRNASNIILTFFSLCFSKASSALVLVLWGFLAALSSELESAGALTVSKILCLSFFFFFLKTWQHN